VRAGTGERAVRSVLVLLYVANDMVVGEEGIPGAVAAALMPEVVELLEGSKGDKEEPR
jgi:hypothetical protein